jgi:rare lipoprotein A
MRTKTSLRARAVYVAGVALMLGVPATAVALSDGVADAQSAQPQTALPVSLDRHWMAYGQKLAVTGNAPAFNAGRRLLLEYAPNRGAWTVVGSGGVGSDGRFRLVATMRQSGSIRVIAAPSGSSSRAVVAAEVIPGTGAAIPASTPKGVVVAAKLVSATGLLDTQAGQHTAVLGTLLARRAGRVVRLELGNGHGWRSVASARTQANGHFVLRYTPSGTGASEVRVVFGGDAFNAAAWGRGRRLTAYRESVASWYDDGGNTACGFHAGMGVANVSLPCGTHVTFRYGGRTVTATVDDRGPYVGGREWDLNQTTAGALGFNGVDTVWSSR